MARSPVRQQQFVVGFALGACLAAIAATAAHAAGADKPSAELDGAWKIVSVEVEGEARPLDEEVRWVIKEAKVFYGGELLAAVTSYPDSTPKGVDLAFQEPRKDYEGIYLTEKDVLKICLNNNTTGPKERPFDFSTKEKPNWRLFTLQRISPADDGPDRAKGFAGIALALEEPDIVVNMVLDKSPAEKAGLRAGDVILQIGNQTVRDLQATVEAVRREMPGSELKIRVRREGNEKDIAVKVGVFPFSLLGLLG